MYNLLTNISWRTCIWSRHYLPVMHDVNFPDIRSLACSIRLKFAKFNTVRRLIISLYHWRVVNIQYEVSFGSFNPGLHWPCLRKIMVRVFISISKYVIIFNESVPSYSDSSLSSFLYEILLVINSLILIFTFVKS